MPIIKFDVSGSDPERATSGGDPPKPGVYVAKVKELKDGHKKGEAPSPDNARLEVTYEIAIGPHKGFPMFDYLSYSEASQWKLDQFLQAVGVADKKKRKGQFKTEDLIGLPVRLRVKADTYEGEYKPKVGAVMAGEDDDLTNPEFNAGADPTEPSGDGLEELGGEGSGGEEGYLTRATLEEALQEENIDQLTEWSKAFDIDPDSIATWEEVVDLILEAQGVGDNGGVEEPEPEPAKATGTAKKAAGTTKKAAAAPAAPATEDDGYDDLEVPALKQELKERGLPVVGIKAKLVERLRANDAEEPF